MKTKHLLATLMATGLLACPLVACGNDAGSGGGSKEITVLYRPGSLSDSAVSGAQRAFPDAKITFVKTADVDTKLTAALRTGQGLPSVVTADPIRYASAAGKFTDVAKSGFTPRSPRPTWTGRSRWARRPPASSSASRSTSAPSRTTTTPRRSPPQVCPPSPRPSASWCPPGTATSRLP
ncbi:hypothetical protein ACFQV2_24575 [Actinokineospora soli]|uniref:Extracellular solute-binding protein n=1 Tax=Actinokineospora soli TaxID=1048753 RepID=A0ABW2TRQ0_9PSEU